MRKLLSTVAAIFFAGSVAWGANLPLLSGPQDPSQLLATLNSLIQSINTGVGGLMNAQTGAVSTSATTVETTLQSFTLPGGTLSTAGQAIRVTCWGGTGANANNKTMKLYFGSTSIATPTAGTNNKGWFLEMIVMRRTATTQGFLGKGVVDTTSVSPGTADAAETLANNILIKCTGTNGTASATDITAQGMITELIK